MADDQGYPRYLKVDLLFDVHFIRCMFKYVEGKKFGFTSIMCLVFLKYKNRDLSKEYRPVKGHVVKQE